jgi:hypothetical protein
MDGNVKIASIAAGVVVLLAVVVMFIMRGSTPATGPGGAANPVQQSIEAANQKAIDAESRAQPGAPVTTSH